MKQGNKMFFYVISVAFGWKAEFVIAVFAKQKNIFWVHDLQKLLRSTLNTYLCESGCKNCSFFGKFGVFCFLETPVLRFALLPYYRQYFMRLSTKFSVISMKLIGSLKIQRSRRLTLLGKTTKTHKYQSLVNFKEQKFFICLSISFFCFFFVCLCF